MSRHWIDEPAAGCAEVPFFGAPLAGLSETEKANYEKDPVFYGVLARFPLAVREIAKVSAYGCKKYSKPMGDMSYLELPNAYELYSDKVVRHMLDEAVQGPRNDADGGLLHAAQTAWNALARLEVFLRQRLRTPSGEPK